MPVARLPACPPVSVRRNYVCVCVRVSVHLWTLLSVVCPFFTLYVPTLSGLFLVSPATIAMLATWLRWGGGLLRPCKLTWLVLGGDPAARSHRVEQFTAL